MRRQKIRKYVNGGDLCRSFQDPDQEGLRGSGGSDRRPASAYLGRDGDGESSRGLPGRHLVVW
jgi:hypothetical protein